MKKLLILSLALIALLGCRPSLSTRVKEECDYCKEFLKQNKCKGDTSLAKVVIKDSTITADSSQTADTLSPNKDVVNSSVKTFESGDSLMKHLDPNLPREQKEKMRDNWNEHKAILSKNIDRHCPDPPAYSRKELDNYYSTVEYRDGIQYHTIGRKSHHIVTQSIEETPMKLYERPMTDHWYFWAFIVATTLFVWSMYYHIRS